MFFMNSIFSLTGESTNAPELFELCNSNHRSDGPFFGSTNVLTFVFDSERYFTSGGFFISVSAGKEMFLLNFTSLFEKNILFL